MLEECIKGLNVKSDGVYFDGTLEEWEKITEIIDAWCGPPEQTITIHCTDGDIILKDLFLI